MTTEPDRDLIYLEGLTMPQTRPTWEPLDLSEFETEVRVIDTFDDDYTPPAPPEPPEPEPVGHLRHRLTWAERVHQDIDDLRLTITQAQASLRDAADGCKAVRFDDEVKIRAQVEAALDRATEALRLIDIYYPNQ